MKKSVVFSEEKCSRMSKILKKSVVIKLLKAFIQAACDTSKKHKRIKKKKETDFFEQKNDLSNKVFLMHQPNRFTLGYLHSSRYTVSKSG
jgi:hypothetical protein